MFACIYLPPANEVCEGYVFTRVCHSVHSGEGEVEGSSWGEVSRPTLRGRLKGLAWGVSRPTPGGRLRGLVGGGVSRPTPRGVSRGGLQAHTWGCVSQHALRQIPPPPADGYCCGRYASYWNAVLFVIKLP